MELYRVYRFGKYRLVPRDRMLYGDDGSESRVGGVTYDLLLHFLNHPLQEIQIETLCAGKWGHGNIPLSEDAFKKRLDRLWRLLKDTDRQHRMYIRRLDASVTFLKVPKEGDESNVAPETEEKERSGLPTVPAMPANFIPRPVELATLRDALLVPTPGFSIALTAYEGMGGIGKTVLAQALCHDSSVQQAFPDGIAWITLGKESTQNDLIRKMRSMGKSIGADLRSCESVFECGNELKSALRDKAALVVVDDVWNAHDLEPFLADAPRSRLLFTTRDQSIAAHVGAEEQSAGLLTAKQSLEFLAKWSGTSTGKIPAESVALIGECGCLPFALAVVGAMLRGKPKQMWRQILTRLRNADLEKLKADFPGYPHSDLFRFIQISVDALDGPTRRCYLTLGVLLEDMPATPAIQQALWNQGAGDALETAERLISLSLAERYEDGIRLHDLYLDYVRVLCPWREALVFIHDAIRLSLQVINDDPRQFAPQLIGRLFGVRDRSAVKTFTDALLASVHFPSLVPLYGGLTPPGTPLQWIFPWESGRGVALSADGGRAVSQSKVGRGWRNQSASLVVWDLERGSIESIVAIEESGPFAIDAHALRALSRLPKGGLAVWDLRTGNQTGAIALGQRVKRCALSSDGSSAVSLSSNGILTRWDAETESELWSKTISVDRVTTFAISPDMRRAVYQTSDSTLQLLDLYLGEEIGALEVSGVSNISRLAITADGLCLCCSRDERLIVWEAATGRQLHTISDRFGFNDVAVSTDGRLSVTSSADAPYLKVWDVALGVELLTLRGHTQGVEYFALSANGSKVVSGSSDGTLRVWNLTAGVNAKDTYGHESPIGAVAASKNGQRAVSAALDGTLEVWDTETGGELIALDGHKDWIRAVAVVGNEAVVSASDRMLAVWDIETGQRLRQHHWKLSFKRFSETFGVALTPDGKTALCAQSHDTIDIFDLNTCHSVRKLSVPPDTEGDTSVVRGVAITTDGKLAVSASEEGIARVWDLESGRELRALRPCQGNLLAVATVGKSKAIVASTDLVLWDLHSDIELFRFCGHTAPVWGIAVSRDQRLVVSASFDRTLRVWSLESGQLLATLTCDGILRCCAFIGSSRIVAGDAGGRVVFVDVVGV